MPQITPIQAFKKESSERSHARKMTGGLLMGRVFSHFDIEKRRIIADLLKSGKTPKDVSQALNLHISTVYREIERGTNPLTKQYDPEYSEHRYRSNLSSKGMHPVLEENKELSSLISEYILNEGLSPEQVVNKLIQQGYTAVPTKSTIYTAIDRGFIPGVTRESLHPKSTNIFSDGTIHLPRWVRDELKISDGDILFLSLADGKIVLQKDID